MDSKPKKNIRDYFLSNPRFLIPAYQRGYKWGVCGSDGSSAAKSLISDIKKAFEKDMSILSKVLPGTKKMTFSIL